MDDALYFTDHHQQVRETVREFARAEVAPVARELDRTSTFPWANVKRMGELGLLGVPWSEELGGSGMDQLSYYLTIHELAKVDASHALTISAHTNLGTSPIVDFGTDEQRRRYVPLLASGQVLGGFGLTEPEAGSDAGGTRTRAALADGEWVIDGEKAFITSGLRADWLTVAVRTGGPGASGISLIAVPGDAAGLERSLLAKMGWWCSDTARLTFTGCRVPAENLIGAENEGFRAIMDNFNGERLLMATSACAFASVCFDEALAWARQRKTFGQPLVEHQAVRHKLVDMRMRIFSAHAWIEAMIGRYDAGPLDGEGVAQLCLLKNHATQTMQFCADQAVQILGAMGFMRGTKSERIYREVKVMMIGGGSEEIMKELAARQLGL